ncbi:MAG: cysteine desulfurase family protein [Prosthecobacter sp.]|uniref:cysteine desulfurase family protein n=1 Tax=Prosthecobacter sp. TaxID=1965333 RepID=UPI0038FEB23A
MIYLDSAATTPTDPAVVEAMLPFLREHFANPSASYAAARTVRKAVQTAREQVATLIGAEADEIIFTSCGTESINTAIASVRALWPEKADLITTSTEHAATLEAAKRWEAQGGHVIRVPVSRDGLVDLDQLRALLRPGHAALVSNLWANNETGVIAPMHEIVEIAHAAGALVHADAVQAVGKIDIDVQSVQVDFLSLSGHKFHAPKGIGALFVSQRVRFAPLLVGGGQENGRRSGTENVPGIVALGTAASLCGQHDLAALRDDFEQRLMSALPDSIIHGARAPRLPNITSICLPGIDAAGMLILLDKAGIACSAGSACHSAALHPSHVLEAMGFEAAHAASTLRFSFSRFNTKTEAEAAADAVIDATHKMRAERGDGSMVISS